MWACIMYSSGFPILYPIAFIFYLVLYWIYKFLILKFYSKSNRSNEILAIKSISYIKYGIIIHMIIGGLMYTNTNILTVNNDDLDSDTLKYFYQITGSKFIKSRFSSTFS